MKRISILISAVVVALAGTSAAQLIPWRFWTFLPQSQMDEIIGETSGETAWRTIASVAAYNRDRDEKEFKEMFLETRVITDLLKSYGIKDVEIFRYPYGTAWDARKGDLWEVEPRRQKLASYNDMVPVLAAYSMPTDTRAELAWVGRGTPEEIQQAKVEGKIVVTEGNMIRVHLEACNKQGALGVIAIGVSGSSSNPSLIPWSQLKPWIILGKPVPGSPDPVSIRPKFGFMLPAPEGRLLKRRLLAGERITVRAQVEAQEVPYNMEDVVALIPGTDPDAGEIILTAHSFEGVVKQGANDDFSGCACILEVARVLNTLIAEGRLPRPKRSIRFLWGPEVEGTGMWVQTHVALMKRMLCNINMDMVGEWLSKNQAFFSLIRTTYGMPHYINDVLENYYRYVGEGSREKLQNEDSPPPALRRIVAPFGADEPFPYAIDWYFGQSDHLVFNDWSVGVPGVMMIAGPDPYAHTSGDLVDRADPTQLKRVAVIGAAAAYTIAAADDAMALRIASETAANGARRIPIQLQSGMTALDEADARTFAEAYKRGLFSVEAAVANEKATLDSVLELAADKARVADHLFKLKQTIVGVGVSAKSALRTHMEAVAARLGVPAVLKIELNEIEKKAASLHPRRTERVRAEGFMECEKAINALPEEIKAKAGYSYATIFTRIDGISDIDELQRLIDGKRSVLDIKRALDAQAPNPSKLQSIIAYLELLKAAGLIEMK